MLIQVIKSNSNIFITHISVVQFWLKNEVSTVSMHYNFAQAVVLVCNLLKGRQPEVYASAIGCVGAFEHMLSRGFPVLLRKPKMIQRHINDNIT